MLLRLQRSYDLADLGVEQSSARHDVHKKGRGRGARARARPALALALLLLHRRPLDPREYQPPHPDDRGGGDGKVTKKKGKAQGQEQSRVGQTSSSSPLPPSKRSSRDSSLAMTIPLAVPLPATMPAVDLERPNWYRPPALVGSLLSFRLPTPTERVTRRPPEGTFAVPVVGPLLVALAFSLSWSSCLYFM